MMVVGRMMLGKTSPVEFTHSQNKFKTEFDRPDLSLFGEPTTKERCRNNRVSLMGNVDEQLTSTSRELQNRN